MFPAPAELGLLLDPPPEPPDPPLSPPLPPPKPPPVDVIVLKDESDPLLPVLLGVVAVPPPPTTIG